MRSPGAHASAGEGACTVRTITSGYPYANECTSGAADGYFQTHEGRFPEPEEVGFEVRALKQGVPRGVQGDPRRKTNEDGPRRGVVPVFAVEAELLLNLEGRCPGYVARVAADIQVVHGP